MRFLAKARNVRRSPFKLRPLADLVRGKGVAFALKYLSTTPLKKAIPLRKVIQSAAANAKSLNNVDINNLIIKDLRIDHGPMYRYFKAGAMGRSNIYRKRQSHISVVLESIDKKEA